MTRGLPRGASGINARRVGGGAAGASPSAVTRRLRKMPRGFLVKRSRRAGGCYRMRPGGQAPALRLEGTHHGPAPLPAMPPPPPEEEGEEEEKVKQEQESPPLPPPRPESPPPAAWSAGNSDGGGPSAVESESKRGVRPAESFPLGPALAGAGNLPLLPRTPLLSPSSPGPLLPPPAAPLCPGAALKRPPRAKAPPAKKAKAVRKLSFADEVTTSPVLGLRIKAAAEGAGSEGPRGARPTLLGEFVCQLCKEPYGDPLALAQHRCSRIVRVEYRCPECHKIFSCPANLASHRRWHKPRPPAPAGPAQDKENSRGGEAARDQHRGAPDSSCCRDPPPPPAAQIPDGSGLGAPAGELFLCPYCRKTFRRQAYLRKHLGTHQGPGGAVGGVATAASLLYGGSLSPPRAPPPPPPQAITFPCHLCGAHFPSADIRDKHRLWHAVREELLLPPPLGLPEDSGAHGEQQIFSCKHCPSTFFSSPGLTRHINKCHPSENRQVLLLQMPVRPGC